MLQGEFTAFPIRVFALFFREFTQNANGTLFQEIAERLSLNLKEFKMITSGFVLRQYREIYGIKQWVMAARLGYSSAVLCDIEKNRKPLTPEIRAMAEKIFEEEKAKQNFAESTQILVSVEA